jgi:hypothetical protein
MNQSGPSKVQRTIPKKTRGVINNNGKKESKPVKAVNRNTVIQRKQRSL